MSGFSRVARRTVVSLVAAASCSILVSRAVAQAKVDPQAQQVLKAFDGLIADAQGFKVTVNIKLTVEQQGQAQSIEFLQQIAAQRPNQFAYSYAGAAGGGSVVSDGKDLSVAMKGSPYYAVEKAPETLAGMIDNPYVLGILSVGNAAPVTTALVAKSPGEKLVANAESVQYGGKVKMGEYECHLLKAVGADMDWQIWIDAGAQPLVRQFVPDLAKAFEKMARLQGGKSPFEGMKVSDVVTYTDWAIDPKFADDTFAFHAPKDATKVDSLMEMFAAAGARGEPPVHALVGQAAPPLELELLDGGRMNLASHKDKDVVILDFWATWCPPCVQAMPIIEKVAGKYKGKGVQLYAVNLQETPDDVRKFLDDVKLKVAVALDTEGSAALAYQAENIPQTVIVGKDGKVQVVMVGLAPNLEESLENDLTALLAGKDLAAQTLAKAKDRRGAGDKNGAGRPNAPSPPAPKEVDRK
jgi:thiol-disulfide isomerase/thioredoxin